MVKKNDFDVQGIESGLKRLELSCDITTKMKSRNETKHISKQIDLMDALDAQHVQSAIIVEAMALAPSSENFTIENIEFKEICTETKSSKSIKAMDGFDVSFAK